MNKIFIGCLAHRHTGGLTLAHQLCYELRNQGYDAYMCYYYGFTQEKTNPVNEHYEKYNLPYVTKVEDDKGNIVVAPETHVRMLRGIKYSQKVIWWMSVDNYFKTLKTKKNRVLDLFGLRRYNICRKDIIHLAQSYYAIDFLKKKGIDENRIFYLSDYLDDDFVDINANSEIKRNKVLYNPKKGYVFTKKLLEKAPEIEWYPLESLTPEQMRHVLRTSKVYIDFGNHPGKDRIPREAAISGCCVITGKRGSAGFQGDVPIPNDYKFDDTEDVIPLIIEKIKSCVDDYEMLSPDFAEYREMIRKEHSKFIEDIKNIFPKIIRSIN